MAKTFFQRTLEHTHTHIIWLDVHIFLLHQFMHIKHVSVCIIKCRTTVKKHPNKSLFYVTISPKLEDITFRKKHHILKYENRKSEMFFTWQKQYISYPKSYFSVDLLSFHQIISGLFLWIRNHLLSTFSCFLLFALLYQPSIVNWQTHNSNLYWFSLFMFVCICVLRSIWPVNLKSISGQPSISPLHILSDRV